MSPQPFSASREAVAWIILNLERGAIKLKEMAVESVERIPFLSYSFGYQTFDCEYNLLERCDTDHFFIGWSFTEKMDLGGFCQIEIGNFRLFIHQDILKMLEGKELTLETVEVGYPTSTKKACKLLKARRKEGEEGELYFGPEKGTA